MRHSRVLFAFAIAAMLAVAGSAWSPAWATISTPYHTITAGGGSCQINVGLAFDGKHLIVSCESDGRIDVVSSSNGALVSTHKPVGLFRPGAMAWDNVHKKLWICNSESDIGWLDTSWKYTKAFTSNGCFDGLAYDGSDNTLWASPDASSTITHYKIGGTVMHAHTFTGTDLGNTHNSGIAVGGKLLYLANDGGFQIYTAPKDFSTPPVLFATLSRRLEDMECDNVTFSAQNKTVMWVIDAYDRTVNAFVIPNGSCSFGGGAIIAKSNGCTVTGVAGTATGTKPLITFTGPEDLTYRATIAWGDSTTSDGTITSKGGGNFQVSGAHTYAAHGTFVITVTVADAKSASNHSSATCAATIDPATPVTVQAATTTTHVTTTTVAAQLPRTGSSNTTPLTATALAVIVLGGAALGLTHRRRVT
jgi:LPXTG-motif cell wall-anchored protein